jgi:hypothetical protein
MTKHEHTGLQQAGAASFDKVGERLREMHDHAKETWDSANPEEVRYERYWYGRMTALQDAIDALASQTPTPPPVTCESCKSTNTQQYENAGGLKMYICHDCGWHYEVMGAETGE